MKIASRHSRGLPFFGQTPVSGSRFQLLGLLLLTLFVGGCAMVGPDYVQPPAPVSDSWIDTAKDEDLSKASVEYADWWQNLNDPVLDRLVQMAYEQNLPLQIAGLRVLEARAELGFVTGQLYPQQQQASADLLAIGASQNDANTLGIDHRWASGGFGFDAAWEMDFWGKFRRAVQSADSDFLAAISDYDDLLVTLTAEVARAYTLIRTFEERILIAEQNIAIQQRSLEITQALFEAGLVTELDNQQATGLLNTTKALIPALEASRRQAQNSLSILLGLSPRNLDDIIGVKGRIPLAPAEIAVGIPADLLRRRPDIRRAEQLAAAQSSLIGVAKADLYPHFSLVGSIGLRSSDGAPTRDGGRGGSSFGDLFDGDSIEYFIGPTFTWDILNYGRIKNRVRVQDARFQQLQVNYQDTVLRAAREVEDNMVGFLRGQDEAGFLNKSVKAYQRSVELAQTQYREGLVDYQRVLDNQRALTAEQDRLLAIEGDVILSLIGMYKALGGGWQMRVGNDFVPEKVQKELAERTDWGDLLESDEQQPKATTESSGWRSPDW